MDRNPQGPQGAPATEKKTLANEQRVQPRRALTIPERGASENGATAITTLRMARADMYRTGCVGQVLCLVLTYTSLMLTGQSSYVVTVPSYSSCGLGLDNFPRSPWPTNGRARIQIEKGTSHLGLSARSSDLKFLIMLLLNLFCKTRPVEQWCVCREHGAQAPTPWGSSSAPSQRANTAAPARAGHGGGGTHPASIPQLRKQHQQIKK